MTKQELAKGAWPPRSPEAALRLHGPARLQRTRWFAAGRPGRVLLDRRPHRCLHGTDLPESPRAFAPSASRVDDRHRLRPRRGEGPVGAWPRHTANRRRRHRRVPRGSEEVNGRTPACRVRTQRAVDVQADGAHLDRAGRWARLYDFGAGRLPVFLANLAKLARLGLASGKRMGTRWRCSHSPSLPRSPHATVAPAAHYVLDTLMYPVPRGFPVDRRHQQHVVIGVDVSDRRRYGKSYRVRIRRPSGRGPSDPAAGTRRRVACDRLGPVRRTIGNNSRIAPANSA